ncbi:MAG: hypothetical protein HXY22_07555 [Alphaproteobacteria bacterium]|nr:hypothetical protein [Alphaproteobacteria bacterium]
MPFLRLLAALAVALVLSAGSSVHANEPEEAPPPLDPSRSAYVPMPLLATPVTVNGRLKGYFVLQVTLKATNSDAADALRYKVAQLQDAFVREVHRDSVMLNGSGREVDGLALSERLLARARAVDGGDTIVSIAIEDSTNAMMRPQVEEKPQEEKASSGGH